MFLHQKQGPFFFQVSTPLSGEMLLSYQFCLSFFFWPDNLGVVPCFFPPTLDPAWVWQNFRGLGHIHRGIDPSNKAVPRESWVRVWSFWTGRILGRWKDPTFGSQKMESEPFGNISSIFGTNNSKVVGKFVVCCFRNQFSNNKFLHFKHQTLSWGVECDRLVIISTSSRPRNNLYCVILGFLGLLNNFLWGCIHLDASSWIDHFVGFPSLLKKSLWKFLGPRMEMRLVPNESF